MSFDPRLGTRRASGSVVPDSFAPKRCAKGQQRDSTSRLRAKTAAREGHGFLRFLASEEDHALLGRIPFGVDCDEMAQPSRALP